MTVGYEWIVEVVDEDGDILDTTAWPTAREAVFHMADKLPDGHGYDFGLVRNDGDDVEGLADRQWAYVRNGALPDEFDGGAAIPKRLREELRGAQA